MIGTSKAALSSDTIEDATVHNNQESEPDSVSTDMWETKHATTDPEEQIPASVAVNAAVADVHLQTAVTPILQKYDSVHIQQVHIFGHDYINSENQQRQYDEEQTSTMRSMTKASKYVSNLIDLTPEIEGITTDGTNVVFHESYNNSVIQATTARMTPGLEQHEATAATATDAARRTRSHLQSRPSSATATATATATQVSTIYIISMLQSFVYSYTACSPCAVQLPH